MEFSKCPMLSLCVYNINSWEFVVCVFLWVNIYLQTSPLANLNLNSCQSLLGQLPSIFLPSHPYIACGGNLPVQDLPLVYICVCVLFAFVLCVVGICICIPVDSFLVGAKHGNDFRADISTRIQPLLQTSINFPYLHNSGGKLYHTTFSRSKTGQLDF